MNKILTSAGILALGAAGAQAVGYAPGFASADLSKPWSIGLTMNGFYDSNPLCYPDGGWPVAGGSNLPKIESWGYELSPYVSAAYSTDTTQLGGRYTFSLDYYADMPNNKTDYSHILSLFANHRFNERMTLNFDDNFVYSQEPEVLSQASGTIGVPYRTQQSSFANNANINLRNSLSERVDLVFGYANRYVNYDQNPEDVMSPTNPLGGGSLSAMLDRVENYVLANLEYKLNPQAMVLGGFQYGQINYLGDGYIQANNPDPATNPTSDSRNSRNYYMYVGGTYAFNPDLSVSLKAGAQYTDLYNSPSGYTGWNSGWAPYVDLSGVWRFTTKGTLQVGYSQSFSQTFVQAANATTMVPYVTLSYALTEKLTLSGLGKVSISEFNGGMYDGQSYQLWMLGVNAAYALNKHLSLNLGYNYDDLNSDSTAVTPYDRSRVYFGVTARY